MKKFVFTLAAIAVFFSCTKTEVPAPVNNDGGSGHAMLSVSIQSGSAGTKANYETMDSANASESKIQNVQIFVFRAGSSSSAGELDIAESRGFDIPLDATPGASGWKDSSWKIRCSTGEREIWAVVNDSEDHTKGANAVSTKEQFLALQHELRNSTPTKLLMIGHVDKFLNEGSEVLSIPVTRYVAAVVLNQITNDFSSPSYQKNGDFKIHRAYLLNVPGMINFGMTSNPGTYDINFWYARRAIEGNYAGISSNVPSEAGYKPMIVEDLGDAVVNYGQTHTVKHIFYSYPHDSVGSEDISGAYSARATLLVLEAYVKNSAGVDKLYYYPVVLGSYDETTHVYSARPLESNKRYTVNLIVHRPGSDNPNLPVKFDNLTPEITVSPWGDGDSYSQEI